MAETEPSADFENHTEEGHKNFTTLRQELREKVRNLPQEAGIYKYFNEKNEIIYVGKAKNLKKRVSSYFTKSHQYDRKTRQLVRQIVDLEITVVNTEVDALLLESNLIKTHQPHYNILLKDGKTYPYLCISDEPFPRVFTTRQPDKVKGEHFGPYTNGKTLHALTELIKQLYPLRTCYFHLSPENIAAGKYKVCLEYHIKNCKGACQGLETEAEYEKYIEQIRLILKGKTSLAKEYFKSRMQQAAEKMQFEQAHQEKLKLQALTEYQSKSLITNPNISDTEVFTAEEDDTTLYINYLRIENGSIIYTQNESFKKKLEENATEILPLIVVEFRQKFKSTARRIVCNLPLELPLPEVEVVQPKIGDLKGLLDLSLKNVTFFKKEKIRKKLTFTEEKSENKYKVLEQLQKDLSLPRLPLHIECFDNSHLQGTDTVSSMVCFIGGKPSKRNYRKYHIKTVEGIDDFASMYEVVSRRYRRVLEEKQPLPDLIVVDGGKGQLSSAVRAMQELGVYGKVPIIGIAKRMEEIFFPQDSFATYINKKSPSLKLIQHLRNEAHRFAITFQRATRSKKALQNDLENIKGIGKQTVEKLLLHFKSIKKMEAAADGEIAQVVGNAKAKLIRDYFKSL
ncbi:excinuclease ABC subunit UvrC [Hugenholtzia roseola]|uniref:excinuclease ABC subunit UvrC n=1 Tax=Hugenholtzia roseola TaxID=1002 RepID=UPI0004273DB0|nr:excinuclease ABC subunit UvrC [Hugenholtzia roseola]